MIAFLVLMLLTVLHPHDDDLLRREYRLKSNGEITLVDDTMIRETLLPRGRYLVRHRVDGDAHSVVITPVPDRKNPSRPPVVVPATLLPAQDAYRTSLVLAIPPREDRPNEKYYRIVKIDIAGENVEHLF